MEQIQYDINKLQEKVDKTFQLYEENEIDTTALETKLDKSNIQITDANINNYLSQSYGRQRCYGMRNTTRRESINYMFEHFKRQKSCYQDLLVEFKKSGEPI